MFSSNFWVFKVLVLFTLISAVICSYKNDDFVGIFRPYRSRNIKAETGVELRGDKRNSLKGLVGGEEKKANCYGRGGYRTGGYGGGGLPIIIIGGGAGGVVPGAGGGTAPGGGGATGGGVPGPGGASPAAAAAGNAPSGDSSTSVPTA